MSYSTYGPLIWFLLAALQAVSCKTKHNVKYFLIHLLQASALFPDTKYSDKRPVVVVALGQEPVMISRFN